MNIKSMITSLVAVLVMVATPGYRSLIGNVLALLGRRGYINMGGYRSFTAVDLVQNAECEFTVTLMEAMAISQIIVRTALSAADQTANLGIKIKVGNTDVIPSDMTLTGAGVQASLAFVSLAVFNAAETVGQMLFALTPGAGNARTQATITLINWGAGALNDMTISIVAARFLPQRV